MRPLGNRWTSRTKCSTVSSPGRPNRAANGSAKPPGSSHSRLRVGPGATTFGRMPRGPNAAASVFETDSRAVLEAA
jgi:hypothetical protein